jgi:hypothetical protein
MPVEITSRQQPHRARDVGQKPRDLPDEVGDAGVLPLCAVHRATQLERLQRPSFVGGDQLVPMGGERVEGLAERAVLITPGRASSCRVGRCSLRCGRAPVHPPGRTAGPDTAVERHRRPEQGTRAT